MRFYDAFCGIGGFRLGLQRAGHTCVGECDNSPTAKKIYARHFGDWPEGDIRDVDGIPPCDLFCGGFPCPSFSVAGKGLGLEDPRGELFFEMCRLIKAERPKLLLFENVKGILSHGRGRTYAIILSALEELGYDVQWQVLNSKYWIPQNRERIYIIGSLREEPRPQILPLGGEQKLPSPKERKKQKGRAGLRSTVSTIDARYGALRNAGETYLIYLTNTKANLKKRVQKRKEAWSVTCTPSFGVIEPRLVADRTRTKAGLGRRLESPKKHTNALTSVSKDNLVVEPKLEKINKGQMQAYRVYDPKGVASTIVGTAGGIGAKTGLYRVDERVRRLTPLECERLQGFPDNWTQGLSDSARYEHIGNAVTVGVIEELGLRIKKYETQCRESNKPKASSENRR